MKFKRMMNKSTLFLLLLWTLGSFSATCQVPWNAESGFYKLNDNLEYKKLYDIEFFRGVPGVSKNKDGTENLNHCIYQVYVENKNGKIKFCEINIDLVDDVYIKYYNYSDSTTSSYSIPIADFKMKDGIDHLALFKSVKPPKQTTILLAKHQGFMLIDLPIIFNDMKVIVHFKPETF